MEGMSVSNFEREAECVSRVRRKSVTYRGRRGVEFGDGDGKFLADPR